MARYRSVEAYRERMMAEMEREIREQQAWEAEYERKQKEARAWVPQRYTFDCGWECA